MSGHLVLLIMIYAIFPIVELSLRSNALLQKLKIWNNICNYRLKVNMQERK